jgi:RHS repeat-associated protein
VKRHDYLPFGEELFAGAGSRTVAQGYAANDGVRQQFTSKERDVETGLDYFLARYYSSTQGRFTSPDEFNGGPDELYYFVSDSSANPAFYADLTNPQSLNKYQYAYLNPLRYVDPDGHEPEQEPRPVPGQALPITPPFPTPGPMPIFPPILPDPLRFKEPHPDAIPPLVTEGPTPVPLPDNKPDLYKPIIPEDAQIRFGPSPNKPIIAPVAPRSPDAASHRRNRTPSNKPKHQRGTRRKNVDKGGEKADPRREGMPFHRKRPRKWKGPWPPKEDQK